MRAENIYTSISRIIFIDIRTQPVKFTNMASYNYYFSIKHTSTSEDRWRRIDCTCLSTCCFVVNIVLTIYG